MIGSIDNLHIPNRFESLLSSRTFKAEPLIISVNADLQAFDYLRNKVNIQQGGIITFLLGTTGIGKTTAVYSASVHISEKFTTVLSVPPQIELRGVAEWLDKNLPKKSEKTTLVLFDGREITDDTVGLKQFLSALNQILRRRNDLLFVWPTTDSEWHQTLRMTAETIGGSNIAPEDSDITIQGPTRDDWVNALERILIQLDLSFNDIAIDASILQQTKDDSRTIGDFLEKIGRIIVQRTKDTRKLKGLPSLVFVITSGNEIVGEANRIRRAGTFIVKAEELLAYSPRSEAGKWWKARIKNPQHHLAYIISLFNARLTTLSPSSVAYACLHHGADLLQTKVKEHGIIRHTINAGTTLRATDLYRYLIGQELKELTSSRKGKTKDASLQAYESIQSLSVNHHKEINVAICKLLNEHLKEFEFAKAQFEVDAGDQNLFTDCIIPFGGQEHYLEFHHIKPSNCNASRMSSYIMSKLRSYAIHYNLIPR